jgi:integrase
MHAFSKFFKFAIRNHWCRENPMKLVKIPSDADAVRIHVISPKEEKKYFRWAIRYPDLPDVGRLMLNQGMRPEEVVALRKDDIDLFRGQLHVRKGKTKSARRTLDLISESHKILAHRMLKAGEWLFPSRRLPGQHVKRLNTTHDKVCGKVGLNFVLYDFAIASQRGWRKRGSTWRPWRQSLDIPQFGSLSAMSTLRQSTDAKR